MPLTRGTDVACIFVNDTANREVIRNLKENDVKLLALRCAGFNNVDLKAAEEAELPVVRVPQYSPYAVAEHAVALMLSLNRKIHRAYWRTRDGNFSLHGLMGFDMNGKRPASSERENRQNPHPHSQRLRDEHPGL